MALPTGNFPVLSEFFGVSLSHLLHCTNTMLVKNAFFLPRISSGKGPPFDSSQEQPVFPYKWNLAQLLCRISILITRTQTIATIAFQFLSLYFRRFCLFVPLWVVAPFQWQIKSAFSPIVTDKTAGAGIVQFVR